MAATRRQFLKGVAGTGIALSSAPVLAQRAAADELAPLTWPPPSTDLLFDQDQLSTTSLLHESGCRRNAGPTAGYTSPTVSKCDVPGSGPTRLNFPGGNAALIAPIAGMVPRDEFTITFDVLNDSGQDFTNAPFPAAQTFLIANAIMIWRYAADGIAVLNFSTNQGGTWTISPGEWPAGTWKSFTLWWRRSDNTLEAMMDTDFGGRIVGGPPATSPPPVGYPPKGTDDGFQLGGTTGGSFPFDIAATKVHRWFWPFDTTSTHDDPVLSIDASSSVGPWHEGLSGVLALYEGFWEVPETDPVYTDIRDQQLALVFDEAGSKVVRFAGFLNYIDITETPPGSGSFTYDWSGLDEKLDALLASRPNLLLHASLDYTPEILQPSGGDHRSPPTDFAKWATIASDVVGHVKGRYGSQFHSVTMWNEPDIGSYWTGTAAQMYSLWAQTQTKLLSDHPDMLMGNPEYTTIAAVENFYSWLAGQSSALKASITAIYHHDFSQDLHSTRSDNARARAAATNAGVGPVPIRITEYNLRLGQIPERHDDPESWYVTQPEHFTSVYAAAYAVAFLRESLEDEDVDIVSFAAIGTAALFWGIQALVSSYTGETPEPPIIPYPANGAITLLAKLGGDRIEAEANWPTCRALATEDTNGVITVLYANFKPYRGFIDDTSFDLDWAGLPAAYSWTQWQLDEDHIVNDRMVQLGTGNQTNLPSSVTLGNLGIGAIQIVPT